MRGNEVSTLTYPPTVIVVHRKERRDKCSVEPLRGRPDFQFMNYPLKEPFGKVGYVRLGLGGPLLSKSDQSSGLVLLDATWRLAERMESALADVPVRSLPSLVTAYPRASKLSADPEGGLATIEAVFAALRMLDRSTAGLLDEYRWRDEFLRHNPSLSDDQ